MTRKALLFACIAPLLSGFLLGAAIRWPECSLLVWVGLIPLAAAIRFNNQKSDLLLGALLGGFVFHSLGLDWVRVSRGGEGIDGPNALNWMILALLGGGYWATTILLASFMIPKSDRWSPMIFAFWWIAHEWGRRLLMRWIDGVGFPWLSLGLPIVEYPRISQWADVGGIWLLAGLVAFMNAYSFLYLVINLHKTWTRKSRAGQSLSLRSAGMILGNLVNSP